MTSAATIAAAYPGADSVASDLVALAAQLGTDPAWLANVIQFESRWNPAARNRLSGASGLIQFMPATAKGLGTTTDAIRGMSAAQQLPLIARYFSRFAGRLHTQEDVFMAVFYPVAVGQGPSYRFAARVTASNPGIFTAGDYTRKALKVARIPVSSPHPVAGGPSTPSISLAPRRGRGDPTRTLILGSSAVVFLLIALAALTARRRMR